MLDTAVPQCDAQQKGTKSEKEQQDHGNTSGNNNKLEKYCYYVVIELLFVKFYISVMF